jgi:hypothetical protein
MRNIRLKVEQYDSKDLMVKYSVKNVIQFLPHYLYEYITSPFNFEDFNFRTYGYYNDVGIYLHPMYYGDKIEVFDILKLRYADYHKWKYSIGIVMGFGDFIDIKIFNEDCGDRVYLALFEKIFEYRDQYKELL